MRSSVSTSASRRLKNGKDSLAPLPGIALIVLSASAFVAMAIFSLFVYAGDSNVTVSLTSRFTIA